MDWHNIGKAFHIFDSLKEPGKHCNILRNMNE